MKIVVGMTAALVLAGCGSQNKLERQYIPDRATFGADLLPVPPSPPPGPPPPHVDVINPDPTSKAGGSLPGPETVESIRGTWTFITPQTVTRVEQKTAAFSRYFLYAGVPEPTDTPFLVITVSKDSRSVAESDPANFKITGQRDYVFNGNIVHEWTGNARTGAGFSELLIKRPPSAEGGGGSADFCHAMALAKSPEQRDVALGILNSITWKAEP